MQDHRSSCKEKFRNKKIFRAHDKACFKSETSSECSKCKHVFRSSKQFRSHEEMCSKKHELEEKSLMLECFYCDETFRSRRKQRVHSETCNGNIIPKGSKKNSARLLVDILECCYCAKVCKDERKLLSHEKVCLDSNPSPLLQSKKMRRFLTPEKSSTPRDSSSRVSAEVSLIECSNCQGTFSSKRKFRAHSESCSLRKVKKKNRKNSKHIPLMKCKHCAKPIQDERNILYHEKSCSDSYTDVSLQCLTKPSLKSDSSPIRKRRDEGEVEDGDEFGTPSRRSGRSRAPVSYEEPIIEIDISDETSPEEEIKKKKFTLASSIEPRKEMSSSTSLSRKSSTIISSSNSVQLYSKSPVRLSLKLKTIDNSVEMKDLTSSSESSSDSNNSSQSSPHDSGKFFSIGRMVASPAGGFKLKLNRVNKPKPEIKKPSEKNQATPSMSNYFMPRVSRSVSKDIGISPQKLAMLITDSPKV